MGSKCVSGRSNSFFSRVSTAFHSSISNRMMSLNSPLRSDTPGPPPMSLHRVLPGPVDFPLGRFSGSKEAGSKEVASGGGALAERAAAQFGPLDHRRDVRLV